MPSKIWRRAWAGLVLVAALGGPASAQPQIVWQVENPFRFFLDAADTEVHRATWASLSPEERKSPVLAAERLLSARHPEGWSATMYDKTCWEANRNRYACRERADYLNPKSHTVLASLRGSTTRRWSIAPGSRPRRAAEGAARR